MSCPNMKFLFFTSSTHTGLDCVKKSATKISCLGPFKEIKKREIVACKAEQRRLRMVWTIRYVSVLLPCYCISRELETLLPPPPRIFLLRSPSAKTTTTTLRLPFRSAKSPKISSNHVPFYELFILWYILFKIDLKCITSMLLYLHWFTSLWLLYLKQNWPILLLFLLDDSSDQEIWHRPKGKTTF